MNYSKIISLANEEFQYEYFSYKVGRNVLDKILRFFTDINLVELVTPKGIFENYDNLDFYNIFLKPAVNGEKDINEATNIFFACLLKLYYNQNYIFENILDEDKFDDNICSKFINDLEKNMIDLEKLLREKAYQEYHDNYVIDMRNKKAKKFFSELTNQLISNDEWSKVWDDNWKTKTNYSCWEEEEEGDSYFYTCAIEGKPPTNWQSIVLGFCSIFQSIISDYLFRLQYVKYECLVDEISDMLSKLPLNKKLEIINKHKNKLANIKNDIDKIIKELPQDEKIQYKMLKPRRLSVDESNSARLTNFLKKNEENKKN